MFIDKVKGSIVKRNMNPYEQVIRTIEDTRQIIGLSKNDYVALKYAERACGIDTRCKYIEEV